MLANGVICNRVIIEVDNCHILKSDGLSGKGEESVFFPKQKLKD